MFRMQTLTGQQNLGFLMKLAEAEYRPSLKELIGVESVEAEEARQGLPAALVEEWEVASEPLGLERPHISSCQPCLKP